MAEDKKPENPAFPIVEKRYDGYGLLYDETHFGMTLRDYFAAKAMPNFINATLTIRGQGVSESITQAAKYAYEIADAMLKERVK